MTEEKKEYLLHNYSSKRKSILSKILCCFRSDQNQEDESNMFPLVPCKSVDQEILTGAEYRVRDFAAERLYLLGSSHHRMFAKFSHATIEEEMTKSIGEIQSEVKEELWRQRYQIFSKFDEGIKLDRDSWKNTTHEKIAKFIAKYISQTCIVEKVLDSFCGVGGNTIQLAKLFKVYAVDIDSTKINYAKHNAKLYQVEKNIEFVESDYLELDEKYQTDIAFLAPDYSYSGNSLDLLTMVKPDFVEVINKSLAHSATILLYFPPTVNPHQIADLLMANTNLDAKAQFMILFSEGKLKAITCLLGAQVSLPTKDIRDLLISKLHIKRSSTKKLESILKTVGLKKCIESLTDVEDLLQNDDITKEQMGEKWFQLIQESSPLWPIPLNESTEISAGMDKFDETPMSPSTPLIKPYLSFLEEEAKT
jgi:SAM-dependent methyltransferase